MCRSIYRASVSIARILRRPDFSRSRSCSAGVDVAANSSLIWRRVRVEALLVRFRLFLGTLEVIER